MRPPPPKLGRQALHVGKLAQRWLVDLGRFQREERTIEIRQAQIHAAPEPQQPVHPGERWIRQVREPGAGEIAIGRFRLQRHA